MSTSPNSRVPLYFIRSTTHGGTVARSANRDGGLCWSNDSRGSHVTLRFFDRTLAEKVASTFPNAEVYAPMSLVEPTDRVKSFVADGESYARNAIGEVAK